MTKIELPPLPVWMSRYTVPADDFEGGDDRCLEGLMEEYATAAIEPYAKRIAELEAALQPRPEVVGVTLDGCLETLFRVGEYLGIDYVAARKAPSAPSDVYIKAIEDRAALQSQYKTQFEVWRSTDMCGECWSWDEVDQYEYDRASPEDRQIIQIIKEG